MAPPVWSANGFIEVRTYDRLTSKDGQALKRWMMRWANGKPNAGPSMLPKGKLWKCTDVTVRGDKVMVAFETNAPADQRVIHDLGNEVIGRDGMGGMFLEVTKDIMAPDGMEQRVYGFSWGDQDIRGKALQVVGFDISKNAGFSESKERGAVVAMNPFGRFVNSDIQGELAVLVGGDGAGRLLEELEDRLGGGFDDVPWDGLSEGYRTPQPFMGAPRRKEVYGGLIGDEYKKGLKKGFVDLGTVNPNGPYVRNLSVTRVVEGILKTAKKGVAFIRDPEDVLKAAGISLKNIEDEIRTWYMGDLEDEAQFVGDYASKFEELVKRMPVKFMAVQGKTGAGYRVVFTPLETIRAEAKRTMGESVEMDEALAIAQGRLASHDYDVPKPGKVGPKPKRKLKVTNKWRKDYLDMAIRGQTGQVLEPVEAYVKGVWAVHGGRNGWQISHAPTGMYAFGGFHKKADAQAAVDAIIDEMPAVMTIGRNAEPADVSSFEMQLRKYEPRMKEFVAMAREGNLAPKGKGRMEDVEVEDGELEEAMASGVTSYNVPAPKDLEGGRKIDHSANPTVVEYAVRFLPKKGVSAAARETVKRLHGYQNMFIDSKMVPVSIDQKKLEMAIWDRLVDHVKQTIASFKPGKQDMALGSVADIHRLKKRDAAKLKKLAAERLGVKFEDVEADGEPLDDETGFLWPFDMAEAKKAARGEDGDRPFDLAEAKVRRARKVKAKKARKRQRMVAKGASPDKPDKVLSSYLNISTEEGDWERKVTYKAPMAPSGSPPEAERALLILDDSEIDDGAYNEIVGYLGRPETERQRAGDKALWTAYDTDGKVVASNLWFDDAVSELLLHYNDEFEQYYADLEKRRPQQKVAGVFR